MSSAPTLENAIEASVAKVKDGSWTQQDAIFHMLMVLLQHEADKVAEGCVIKHHQNEREKRMLEQAVAAGIKFSQTER